MLSQPWPSPGPAQAQLTLTSPLPRSNSPERLRAGGGPGTSSNNYRSRSWENSTSVTSRERTRDSSYLSRAYPAPSRSYGRSISFGKDSYLSPVTAPRKSSAESYTGGILKHTNSSSNSNNNNNNHEQPVSILSRGGSGDVSGVGRRQRHNTLTFGVSGEDLDRARTNIQKYTRRLSDDTRPSLQPERSLNKTSSRYSLPDVFDSLSTPHYYDTRLERQQMVENIMVSFTDCSTLIGRAPTMLGSHWLRASECCLCHQSDAIKNQLVANRA